MSGWMDELELAQRQVARAASLLAGDFTPTVDLAPAARAMERAMANLFDAVDRRAPGLTSAQSALDELGFAHGVLETEAPELSAVGACADALIQARGHVTAAHTALGALRDDPRGATQGEMLASGDVPRLHQLERPSLTLAVRVAAPRPPPPARPEPLPKATTFEALRENTAELARRNVVRGLRREAEAARIELEALRAAELAAAAAEPPPEGFDPDARPAIDERGFIRERTRFHFEEVAMLGLQRAPMFGDRWRDVLVLEQRMCRAIDAIVAMGPDAVSCLEPLVFDSPAKDASRVFGITMILGCVQGRDALAAAERVFVDFEKVDPTCADALAAALKLVPHDHLLTCSRELMRDPNPLHRAIGIDVLAHRGLASEEDLVAAASDAAPVAAKALPHLALVAPGRCGPLIERALADPDVDRAVVWLAMALSGHSAARMVLAAAVNGEGGVGAELGDRAALLLALCGDRNDGVLLQERADEAPTPAIVDAVGWVGDPGAFPLLLRLLEHEDEEIGWAAGHALDRMTGAWLVEHVALPAEEIFVEIPPDPKTGIEEDRKLVTVVSNPRDVPPDPAEETVERPSRDPARWSSWIAENGAEMTAGRRFRRGMRYTPRTSLTELDTFPCLLAERHALLWELVIRTGGYERFSPHDFVRVQEAALRAWAPLANRSVTSGTWDRPGRR